VIFVHYEARFVLHKLGHLNRKDVQQQYRPIILPASVSEYASATTTGYSNRLATKDRQ